MTTEEIRVGRAIMTSAGINQLGHPAGVIDRLEEIERDLALRQNAYEDAAMAWYRLRKERERVHATVFIQTEGPVAERKAHADLAIADLGWEEEGRWEALRGIVRVLESRASIGQSLLRAQGQQ